MNEVKRTARTARSHLPLQVTLRRLEKSYLKFKHGETEKSGGGHAKMYFTITAYGKKAISYIRDTRNELWNALPQTVLKLG
jgi:DNA-binding PadR family transcriptional regulator